MSSGPASWIAPDLKAVLDRLTDVQILALTLFGEARSEPIEGIVGVGCVIRNRVTAGLDWWGEGYRGVCLAPYEFSMCVGSQVRTAPIQLRRGAVDGAAPRQRGTDRPGARRVSVGSDRRFSTP
jgi:hypothetical protein